MRRVHFFIIQYYITSKVSAQCLLKLLLYFQDTTCGHVWMVSKHFFLDWFNKRGILVNIHSHIEIQIFQGVNQFYGELMCQTEEQNLVPLGFEPRIS